MFTGSPDFDDEGEEHVPEEPVRYVGKPTNEVDAAWDKLTEGKPASNFPDLSHQRCVTLKCILIVPIFLIFLKAGTFSYQRKRLSRRGGMRLSRTGMTIGEGIWSGKLAIK